MVGHRLDEKAADPKAQRLGIEAEARDAISTTRLQMSYDELSTEAGKSKLKVVLRKNLNEVLSTGRVRRVYFKSIIVKP